MSDYINRADAIKAFDPLQRQDWYTPWIVETLEDLPSADVAPVRHAYWVGGELGHCSSCGCEGCASDIWSFVDGVGYCPNCGAKMDEEVERI